MACFSLPMSSSAPLLTSADTKTARNPPPRFHPVEKKRRIVEESLLPNTSVARVARAHGVNANQVFYWRKQFQQGLLGPAPSPATLLPVQIADLAAPGFCQIKPQSRLYKPVSEPPTENSA